MSEFTVTFNGHDLTKYFRVTYLERGIGNTRNNKLRKQDNKDFAEYSGYTLDEKSIPMGFRMRYDLIRKSRELADILNVSEPARLIFSDDPDVYYLAIPDGELSTDELSFRKNCDMVWLVPDGVAHAVDPKEFSNVNKEPVVIESDFAGKEAGSEVECPHKLLFSAGTSLLNPNQFTAEVSDVHYRLIDTLDNQSWTISSNGIGVMREILIPFDILETVKRAYPDLFEGLSEGEQVDKLKAVWVKAEGFVHAKGSGPSGNKAYFKVWHVPQNTYVEERKNLTAEIRLMKITLNSTNTIDAQGKVNFIVYAEPSDGTTPSSVSMDYTNVEITLKLPNGQVLTMVSEGTSPSYPLLEATMHGENGAMSFINDTGNVIQVGDPESIDGFDYQVSDKVVIETMANKGKWEVNKGEVLYPNYLSNPQTPNDYSGDFDWTSNPSSVSIVYPKTNKVVWIGGKMHQAIPPNSNGSNTGNFAYTSRFMFDMSVKSLGRIQFQTQNGNEIPFGVIFRDSSANRRELIVQIYVHKELVYSETLSNKKFNGYFFELSLERFGSELTTRIGQIGKIANGVVEKTATFVKTINLESIKGVPITSITQNGGGFAKEAKGRLEFTDTRFTWVNVDKWQNVPNIFNKGDVLVIDTEAGKGYLNDVERPELLPLGNQYDGFQVSKGTTDILCVPSTWADMPDVKGIVREAFL